MNLNKMNIIVTGANGVTGSALIIHFYNRANFIIGTVRNLSNKIDITNGRAMIQMDLLDRFSLEESLVEIEKEVGNIHVVINVVGGFSMGCHIEEKHDLWNYMYNTNFITTLNMCQQILPKMKQQKFGRIINFGAQAAENSMPLAGPYCVSKAAVHTLTKTIALETPDYITCNAILPGIIDTPINRKSMPEADQNNWSLPEQIAEIVEKIILSDVNGTLIRV